MDFELSISITHSYLLISAALTKSGQQRVVLDKTV